MALDSDCQWLGKFPCNYDDYFKGEFNEVPEHKTWYTGRVLKSGSVLYVGTKPDPEWWKLGPPQGTNGRPGPFLTTSLDRAKALGGVVLAYTVEWDLEIVFTGKAGGFELQEDVFNAGFEAYYSCKECEMSMVNSIVGDYLDWENVKVVATDKLAAN
ncbi:MAG: hypothetical protein KF784_02430 [Fimbriimonadaceae bacterium]|nr:hypothetical protein [Fimbriimonadaceae bacterium]